MQALAFPLISARKNVMVASHTGSGKTLAYLLPIIQELKRQEVSEGFVSRAKKPRVVILGPTRELTEQIGGVAKSLSHFAKFRSVVINAGTRCVGGLGRDVYKHSFSMYLLCTVTLGPGPVRGHVQVV